MYFSPDYQAHNVDEDIPIGTSILKVKAADADSGQNAEIEYYLSDDHFTVSSNGIISNNRRLDADSNNAYYEFVVTAKDKGTRIKFILNIMIIAEEAQSNPSLDPTNVLVILLNQLTVVFILADRF